MNLQLIKTHQWAILLAFLVGIIVAFPQFYFSYDHSETYQGIYIANSDSEAYYLNRVQEVRDGHPSLNSAHFKDGKDDPYLFPPLDEILVAYLGKTFFLDLNNTILLARFLFPFLGFLAVYGFVFLLSKEKLTAISAATAVCLAKSLLSRGALIALLKGEASVTAFLDLGRPVHPQVDFLFFFGFLLFFWLFFERKRWIWGAASALILGSSFYAYPYTWSFLYAFLGVLCLILLFQKKRQDIKRIALVAMGGIIIAIPYFLNFYEATLYPFFEEIIFRGRLVETHQIILGFLVPSMFIIFLLFFPRKWRQQYIFSLALFIAPFIVLNQQIITGKDFSSGHYHWNYHQPLAVVFLIIILFYQIKFWSRRAGKLFKNINTSKILAFLIIGVSIYTGIVIQSASYAKSEDQILYDQRYGPVVEWLNVNTEKEEVVLAAPEQLDILLIYTSLDSFYPNGPYLSTSNEKLLTALFLFYRLDGVSGEDARDLFLREQERRKISFNVYGAYYKNISGDAKSIPDQILYSFAEKYQDFLLIPLDKFFKMYDIKYVVWDKKNHPKWQPDQYQFLNKVYEEGDFAIYEN